MGWLRDLSLAAQRPAVSFNELARRCLIRSDWPDETRMQERSLASLFGKLDRNEHLQWLADRPGVQQCLAEELSCAVAALRSRLPIALPSRAAQTQYPFPGLPQLRPLDLDEEDLPPGLPTVAATPEGWERHWWTVSNPGDAELVGRWLAARRWARVQRGLAADPGGPTTSRHLYLDVTAQPSAQLDATKLPRSLLVVSCSRAPDSSWTVVTPPPLERWLEDAVRWGLARGSFTVEPDLPALIDWLRTRAAAALDSPLALLGLTAAAASVSSRLRRLDGPLELLRAWFLDRVSDTLDAQDADLSWLKREGLALTLSLVRAALTDRALPWYAARSLDDWMALVPREHGAGPDPRWLEQALRRADENLRPRDIQRALRQLPPSAFRLVQALVGLGLLTSADERRDSYRLSPWWFAQTLSQRAAHELTQGSPLEWAEALLLQPEGPVARALLDSAPNAIAGLVARALENLDPVAPTTVLALEATTLVAGLHVLAGHTLASDDGEALVQEAARLSVTRHGMPQPRCLADGGFGALRDVDGAWLLACWALTEQHGAPRHAPALLAPWSVAALPEQWSTLVDRFAALCAAPDAPIPRAPCLALLHRLRRNANLTHGLVESMHPLEHLAALLERGHSRRLDWRSVESLCVQYFDDTLMGPLAALLQLPLDAAMQAPWFAWLEAGAPSLRGTLLAPTSPIAERLWRAAPPQALHRLAQGGGLPPTVAPWLSDAQCVALVEALTLAELDHQGDAFLRAVSPAFVLAALGKGSDAAAAWRALWLRDGAQAVSVARDLARSAPERLVAALCGAPLSASAAATGLLAELGLDTLPRIAVSHVQAWLHEVVRRRAEGWESAYEHLLHIDALWEPLAGHDDWV